MVRSMVVTCLFLGYQSLGGHQLTYAVPEEQGLSSEGMAKISEWAAKYVEEGKLAGMVTLVARRGDVVHFEAVKLRTSPLRMTLEIEMCDSCALSSIQCSKVFNCCTFHFEMCDSCTLSSIQC